VDRSQIGKESPARYSSGTFISTEIHHWHDEKLDALLVILSFELLCRAVRLDAQGILSYIYDNTVDMLHGAGLCGLVQ